MQQLFQVAASLALNPLVEVGFYGAVIAVGGFLHLRANDPRRLKREAQLQKLHR